MIKRALRRGRHPSPSATPAPATGRQEGRLSRDGLWGEGFRQSISCAATRSGESFGAARRYCTGQDMACPRSRVARSGQQGSRKNSRAMSTMSASPLRMSGPPVPGRRSSRRLRSRLRLRGGPLARTEPDSPSRPGSSHSRRCRPTSSRSRRRRDPSGAARARSTARGPAAVGPVGRGNADEQRTGFWQSEPNDVNFKWLVRKYLVQHKGHFVAG